MTIVAGRAIANNEIAIIGWWLAKPIAGCLGFEITRIYPDGTERVLPAWVPFQGQSNAKWLPQTTSVWPVQKLFWRDLTLRKERDTTALHPLDQKVRYRIRPLVAARAGLTPVTNLPPVTYQGNPVPLAYADDQRFETNAVDVTAKYGDITATFTNGILSGQWLEHAIDPTGKDPSQVAAQVAKRIANSSDPLRTYLAGDVVAAVESLVKRATPASGATVHLALYELKDKELIDLLVKNASRVKLILSNTSKSAQGWDAENRPARKTLHGTPGLEIHDRLFNNAHIGHNKFAVLVDKSGKARAVMTGSTNWTSNGLCAQSNNAIVVESPALAALYLDYWQRLLQDTSTFKKPSKIGASTTNKQGPALRTADAKPIQPVTLPDQTTITPWFSPNTKLATKPAKNPAAPPDLSALYALMQQAREAILFAVFLPSRQGKNSVVEFAIDIGRKNPKVLVFGACSDPTVLPNYQPGKPTQPATYDDGSIHIVRAAALTKDDVAGAFEQEILKPTGANAIIHDKIVVVDPMSPNGFVATGSHNAGYKASYENDENLLIIRQNPSLIQAYAAHVLDVHDHYRFRAVELQLSQQHQKTHAGFLNVDDSWFKPELDAQTGALAHYLSGAP